ncbi:MAG TPA: LacI family DNA-binding transcriptional regulator [Opitutaceae bacterium]|nr:LacI family DNA-binding transcriptional regulator [Opitutaceae bacterium]
MKKTINSTAELARHLGLSRWAVSRAINGHSGVSAETVGLVQSAMQEFGFTPSAHARGLRGRRTGAIGICFRQLNTPITTEKIAHVQRLLSRRGYRPLFELTEVDAGMGVEVINHFISMRVEGVLLIDAPPGAESTNWLKMLKRHNIPAALLEPRSPATANAVQLDREDALARVTERLLTLGHTHFGLLGISREFPLGKPRYDGIARALSARGLDIERCADIIDIPGHRHLGMRYGRELGGKLIDKKKRPTALIALNDEVAAGAMWYLQKLGCNFPADFSLFGFDNLVLSEQTSPALCTVDHNVEASALAAVEMLVKLIELGDPSAKLPVVRIEPRLIFRESIARVHS